MKYIWCVLILLLLDPSKGRLPIVCTYGKYAVDPMVDTSCIDCPEGKFRDTVQWNVTCKDCPAGQVSGTTSLGCKDIEPDAGEEETTGPVAAGGVGVAAGATVGLVYYTTTT